MRLPNLPVLIIAALISAGLSISADIASAQITAPRTLSSVPDRFANLEEQLINRLRATTREQRGYISFIVTQVRNNRLDFSLVVAVERYAMRRRPDYPFPFFERALKFEASKRGIALPKVQLFRTTKIVID